jgi:hypothetical protein
VAPKATRGHGPGRGWRRVRRALEQPMLAMGAAGAEGGFSLPKSSEIIQESTMLMESLWEREESQVLSTEK